MKFVLQPATSADFDAARKYYGSKTGDLCSAALGIAWPHNPDDLEDAKTRTEWSCQQQKDLAENDPTARLVKIVDADNHDEIISFGSWHDYPNGYQHFDGLETTGLRDRNDASIWPRNFNKDLYLGFLDTAFAERPAWIGEGHYWVLTNIVTREPLRRQGAGSLILEWGLQQAAKDGVPAYLEAAAGAKSLYKKHGFREVGVQDVDCEQYGLPGVKFTLARMRADPKV